MGLRPRPKLFVLLVAEQFRSDYLERAAGALGSGGFRRMMEEGAYFPDCRMSASTFTANGLATISTGAYPEAHGIVADSWYDRATQKPVTASLAAFEATTLADELVTADRRARVFGVGTDQDHTSLLAGGSATEVFVMDQKGAFAATTPSDAAWIRSFEKTHSPEKAANARWTALGAKPGATPLRILTFDPARPENFYLLYKSSPMGQAVQFDFGRELIAQEKLGQTENFDFLIMLLGSMASLGYEVGADSPLMREMILHLDRQIENLIGMLNNTLGPASYSLVFTAAHGAPSEPDSTRRSKMAISGEAVVSTVSRALSDRFAIPSLKGAYVESYLYPFLYLRTEQLTRHDISLKKARVLAGQAALQTPGVAGYYTADGDCSHTGEWLRRFRNSFHAVRSGDVMLAYRPEYVEDYGAGRGISYGSLYNYDARVPLFFYGLQFLPQTFEYPVQPVDIAPTIARAIGIGPPSSSIGRVLSETFRR